MWLSGNAPVILVFSHPEQEEAWWVEVKAAFPDAAARAKRTILIDKKTQRFDQDAAAALMDLALPKDAGLYLRPPSITETLTTNLLLVAEMPASVFVATSRFGGDYRAAGEALAERGMRASGWMLRDGMVYSFDSLREEPGSILCEGDVEEHATAEWAESDDLDTRYRFQDLLTRTVQELLSRVALAQRASARALPGNDRPVAEEGHVVGPAAVGARSSVRIPINASQARSATTITPHCRCDFAAWTGPGSVNWSRTTASPRTA